MSRSGELAIRRALGAGVGRIIQQILTESLLLAMAAGGVGLALAAMLVNILIAYAPPEFFVDVRLDWYTALAAWALAAAAGLVVGIAPAIRAAGVPVLTVLTNGPHTGTRAGRRISGWILVPQVAASVSLLVVAAVHARSLARVEFASGFEAAGVQSMQVALRDLTPQPWLGFVGRAKRRRQ